MPGPGAAPGGIVLGTPPVSYCCARQHTWNRHRTGLGGRSTDSRELELGRAPLAERVAKTAPQHLVDEGLFEEAHFGFRRMDVDVDAIRSNLDEEVDLGAPLFDRRHAVGVDDGVRNRPILDDAAIDENVLLAADGPLVAERGNESVDRDAARVFVDLDEIGTVPEQLKEPLRNSGRGRTFKQPAAAARQREADLRICERHLRDQPGDL